MFLFSFRLFQSVNILTDFRSSVKCHLETSRRYRDMHLRRGVSEWHLSLEVSKFRSRGLVEYANKNRFLFFGIALPFYVFDSIILGIFRILASISDSNLLQDQLFPKKSVISIQKISKKIFKKILCPH